MDAIRTVVASRWPLLRQSLETTWAREPNIVVVGAAGSWVETLSKARTLQPDAAVVACLATGRRDTILALRKLERRLACRVVVVGPSEPPAPVWWMLIAGISGYVTLDQPPAELVRAVNAASHGGAMFSAQINPLAAALSWGQRPTWASLSNRELDVARLVASGLPDVAVAGAMGITASTVQKHVSRAMHKLAAGDRAEMVARLFAAGVLASDDLTSPGEVLEGGLTDFGADLFEDFDEPEADERPTAA
jgi:DNA-binding NarL/FixJ family response regulator